MRERLRDPKFFLPRCRRDGYYSAVQCLGTTECWCSDLNGNPIKNTSTRRSKPKCRRDQRRRTPPRLYSQEPDGANSSEGVGGGHRPCNKTDRMQFNSQLIEEFRSEQQRSGQLAGSSDAAVLEWKFNQLDTNANQVLDRQEVRELKKLVKRVSSQLSAASLVDVTQPLEKLHPLNWPALFSLSWYAQQTIKPRRCGRAFGKYCNVNKDDYLSRQEWSNCLARDAASLREYFPCPQKGHLHALGNILTWEALHGLPRLLITSYRVRSLSLSLSLYPYRTCIYHIPMQVNRRLAY